MKTMKKVALAGLLLAGMSAGANAAIDPQATLIWSGTVPGTVATDAYVITGLNGDLSAPTGALQPNSDGTFVSPALTVEMRTNTGTAAAPVAGDLTATTWTLVDAALTYNGIAEATAVLTVNVDGVVTTPGSTIASTDKLVISVDQAVALDEAMVAGAIAQASVTVLATTPAI